MIGNKLDTEAADFRCWKPGARGWRRTSSMLFDQLKVYRMAYELSLAVHKRSLTFPRFEQAELASQMRRSSKSICANLGEGMSKQASAKDVLRFVWMALGSCEETRIWLKYALDLGYIQDEEYEQLKDSYCEVGRMLTGLVKRWSAK
jgi:four helix bundle protein